MEEEFKDIPGYEGIYQINRKGEVKSLERYVDNKGVKVLKKERMLIANTHNHGYRCFNLSINNKHTTNLRYRLVYKTFVGEYDTKYYQIDHINKIRSDDRIENLRLVSIRDNCNNRTDQSEYGIGVIKLKKKYKSSIHINKKLIYLGQFDTPEQASNKYQSVKKQIEEIERVTPLYSFTKTKINKEYFLVFFPINVV